MWIRWLAKFWLADRDQFRYLQWNIVFFFLGFSASDQSITFLSHEKKNNLFSTTSCLNFKTESAQMHYVWLPVWPLKALFVVFRLQDVIAHLLYGVLLHLPHCYYVLIFFSTFSISCVCTQVPVLPERLHLQLLLCVVGLAQMGERDRLDGTEWNQSASGFYRPGSPLARSTCKPLRVKVMKTWKPEENCICS